MKIPAILLASLLLLAACGSRADMSEEEQAAAYIESLESAESVAASEYGAMVDFYCRAMDHHYDSLEPHARAYADALSAGRTEAADSAARELHSKVTALSDKQVVKLGRALWTHLGEMPDSVGRRLEEYLLAHIDRLSHYR